MHKYDSAILNLDGSKKFFEIGSFIAFTENNIKFKSILSGGIGVINAAFLCTMDIDSAIKFWTMAINTDLFKVNEIIASLYETSWSKLSDKKFISEFSKFLIRDTRLKDLKKALKTYIKEDEIRSAKVDLYLDTINLNTLNFETVNINNIPIGQLHSYLLLCICFPEISRLNKTFSLIPEYSNNLVNTLIDNGYQNILSTEETIEPLSFRNIDIIKSSDFLEIENTYNSSLMKKHIKTGYLDTLKALNKLYGKIFYIDYANDEEYLYFDNHIGDSFSDNKDYLICRILNIDTMNKNLVRKKICECLKYTEFRKEDNAVISLIENLGAIFKIEEKEKYTFTELKKAIKKVFKNEMNEYFKIVEDKETLNSLINSKSTILNVDKKTFMEYFLITLSAKPKSYNKLENLFNKLPVKLKIGIVSLIYLMD